MKKLRILSMIFLVAGTLFTFGCRPLCVSCGHEPGAIVIFVDAESRPTRRVADSDGCVRFSADNCGDYTAIDEIDPGLVIILE